MDARRRQLAAFAVVAALAVVTGAAGEEAVESEIAVVVGRESFVRDVTRDDLRELYLRRRRLWANGSPALPVNLPPSHPLRDGFSRRILGRSVQDLVTYWNARYFEGIRPPIVLPSPAAVCAYVAAEPTAIAYVPADEVGDGCRIVLRVTP